MASTNDTRHCPTCRALGILPLDQPHDPDGSIPDPLMLCPSCQQEFRAEGMTWLGAWDIADMTDEELEALAEALVELQDEVARGRDAVIMGNALIGRREIPTSDEVSHQGKVVP